MVRFIFNHLRFLCLVRQIFFSLKAFLTQETVSIIVDSHGEVLKYYKRSNVSPHVKFLLFLSDFNQNLNV